MSVQSIQVLPSNAHARIVVVASILRQIIHSFLGPPVFIDEHFLSSLGNVESRLVARNCSAHVNLFQVFANLTLLLHEVCPFLKLLIKEILIVVVLDLLHCDVVVVVLLLLYQFLLLMHLANLFPLGDLFLLGAEVVVDVGFVNPLLPFSCPVEFVEVLELLDSFDAVVVELGFVHGGVLSGVLDFLLGAQAAVFSVRGQALHFLEASALGARVLVGVLEHALLLEVRGLVAPSVQVLV